MKPKRQKNHETPVLFIGDPELEASVRRVSSLRKLVVERGHFSAEEADAALGYCSVDQARQWQINVDPEIQEKAQFGSSKNSRDYAKVKGKLVLRRS